MSIVVARSSYAQTFHWGVYKLYLVRNRSSPFFFLLYLLKCSLLVIFQVLRQVHLKTNHKLQWLRHYSPIKCHLILRQTYFMFIGVCLLLQKWRKSGRKFRLIDHLINLVTFSCGNIISLRNFSKWADCSVLFPMADSPEKATRKVCHRFVETQLL